MDEPKRRIPLLVKVTALTTLALFIAPATRYIAWRHAKQVLFRAAGRTTYEQLTARHPRDVQMQLVLAMQRLDQPPPAGKTQMEAPLLVAFRDLTNRVPDQPAVYANALRYLAHGRGIVGRAEEYALSSEQAPKHITSADPAILAEFDGYAAAGERIDATNGYFPMMRAASLFAVHRDEEALSAVQRAADKPRWDDYIADEVEGNWRMQRELWGTDNAMVRLLIETCVLYPHHATLSNAMRVATALAVQAEQNGGTERGYAIRRSVRRCGELMVSEGRSLMVSENGCGIATIATARPGGADPLPQSYNPKIQASNNALRIGRYRDYMNQIGHPEEAIAAQRDVAAAEMVQKASSRGPGIDESLNSVNSIFTHWQVGACALLNALWLLIAGASAHALSRIQKPRNTSPFLMRASLCIGAALLAVFILWQANVLPEHYHCQAVSELWHNTSAWLQALAATALPLLIALVSIAYGRRLRIPIGVSLSRGFRHLAVPAACLAILTWSAVIVSWTRPEARLNAYLDHSLHGEGQYNSQLKHIPWPERGP